MSAETDKIHDTFADQLAGFDSKLGATADDVDLVADIQEGIGSLLASSGGNEAIIRRVLQERYDAGDLRKETFQLVKSVLDHFVTEQVPTSPTLATLASGRQPPAVATVVIDRPLGLAVSADDLNTEDDFSKTTIILDDDMPAKSTGNRVQVGSVLRDRFLLQEEVAGGSMGVVYKALDRRLAEAGSEQSNVAIKVLSPQLAQEGQALRALQQEAAKTRCLVHPHIVRFIDLDRDDDLYFLILEWLDGRTLADILDSTDSADIDIDEAFRIVRQIADALDYAHRCGIVHADVKPGNIMIMPSGDAKLFDFGVARVRQSQLDKDFDPAVLGAMTPAYSSMQVLGGEEPVATDDVFSLGCLLYRLVAGYRVFGPRNAAEASVEGMAPQKPQGISDSQWRVMKKALSYSRVTRYETVQRFLEALDDTGADTVSFEAPERFGAEDEGGSPGKWIAMFIVLLGLAGIGAQQMGYLDAWLEHLGLGDAVVDIAGPTDEPEIKDIAAEPEFDIAPTNVDEGEVEVPDADLEESMLTDTEAAEPAEPVVDLIDFSQLPAPAATVSFALGARPADPVRVVLTEDEGPVHVDFLRRGDASSELTLRLEEIGFSGNRSPWATGQYAMSNSGVLVFPAGQERARVTLTTASDERREADQQSTLRLRPTDFAESALAVINVALRDDDQRAYEGELPPNTIAFAANQVSVSESDPAAQIDVVRFNPDDTSIVVGFSVEDISATEGDDYFAPGSYSISFGPGQRATRLLIPLVQDAIAEGDEAFVVKLAVDHENRPAHVSPNIAIMIRDDER